LNESTPAQAAGIDLNSPTIVSLLILHNSLGDKAAVNFAKWLVIGNIPWFAYIFSVSNNFQVFQAVLSEQ